ncbi:SusF/SusE family outer membrane protein [Pedobacter hiemivivus]|uniref:SusF/SusE family outer membrane protein n=1 Tax=Pedobacter hiemivivus TaxID=2530454 RepID=A0A4U1GB14_9SPHI|nr:SusE domain-containing protein [Pedobacter hiemivivus]TCC95490.1 SusF/SusE family outer membrane protein [Pedobacter hiemivivus]TKC61087.1 SusF/SusE family outer membrane protein [Pedobacter hiemivivus]
MKYKILYTLLVLVAFAFGCKETTFDEASKGEALGAFTATAPANNTMLVLNSATPGKTIVISWTAAKPGVNTAPTYKWVVALKSGAIDQPILEFPSDNGGKAATLTLTQKQLDDALKAKGIADGAKADLIWRVIADNGSLKVNGETFNISVTRFGDGVSNFILYGPVSSANVTTINPILTAQSLNFKWQKSFAGKVGANVTYKVKFIKPDGSFTTPLFEFTSNNSGLDSNLSVSYKDFDAKLTAAGFADQSAIATLKWSVEASSGTFTKFSDYTNDISVLRDVSLFMVGDASEFGWDNGNPTHMFRDATNRGAYIYTGYLNVGDFKFITVVGSWETQYGNNGSNGVALKAKGSDPDPGTYHVATAGFYTVKIDINALTFSIAPYSVAGATTYASIGIIGNFNDWADITAMSKSSFNSHIWVITQTIAANTEMKFRIASGWDVNWGVAANADAKYGKTTINAGNLSVKAGTYKILFNDLTGDYIFYNK